MIFNYHQISSTSVKDHQRASTIMKYHEISCTIINNNLPGRQLQSIIISKQQTSTSTIIKCLQQSWNQLSHIISYRQRWNSGFSDIRYYRIPCLMMVSMGFCAIVVLWFADLLVGYEWESGLEFDMILDMVLDMKTISTPWNPENPSNIISTSYNKNGEQPSF